MVQDMRANSLLRHARAKASAQSCYGSQSSRQPGRQAAAAYVTEHVPKSFPLAKSGPSQSCRVRPARGASIGRSTMDLPPENRRSAWPRLTATDDGRRMPTSASLSARHRAGLAGPGAFKGRSACLPRFFSASAARLRGQSTARPHTSIPPNPGSHLGSWAKPRSEGFDVDGVSIGVMYPDGGVSDIQFKPRWPRSAGANDTGMGRARETSTTPDGREKRVQRQVALQEAADEHRISSFQRELHQLGALMLQIVITTCRPTRSWRGRRQTEPWATGWTYAHALRATSATSWPPTCQAHGRAAGHAVLRQQRRNRVLSTDFINTGTYD